MHPASAHAPTKRSLFKIALCAVALVLLATLPVGSGVAAPRIERFPTYRPQTTCSPKPKPGTVKLASYLMKHYRGSGSLGISRSCASSGISEHKEGRAFDWALNANSRRDRRYAANFIHRLRKPDRQGHKAALARRMGIMYVIWNDRIYSATYHYRKQRYKNVGCRRIKGCSASLRHRNHMHISLTRVAARGKTSWYERHGAGKAVHKVKHRVKHVKHRVKHNRRHSRHLAHHRRHKAAHRHEHRRHEAAHQRQHRHDSAAHRKHHRRHKAAHHRYHQRHHSARDHKRYHRKAARHHERDHRKLVRHHKRDHRKAARHHKRDHHAARRHHRRYHHAARRHHRRYHRHHRSARRSARLVAPDSASQPPLAYVEQLPLDAAVATLVRDWRNVTDSAEDALGETDER